MLSFDLRSLDSRALQVDGILTPDDPVWEEGDVRPAGPIAATGRLSSAGSGRFYFSGKLSGTLNDNCRRCLTDVAVRVSDDLHLLFASADDDEADDPDVYQFDPRAHTLDLRPAIREHWLLASPSFLLCREDCKGLCPTCGADLNEGPCECVRETDRRWSALRNSPSAGERTS